MLRERGQRVSSRGELFRGSKRVRAKSEFKELVDGVISMGEINVRDQ